MFGSEVLDIAVGLALIYLVLSILVTGMTEAMSRLAALRAKNLSKGLQNLLDDAGSENLVKEFYQTSLMQSFIQPGKRWRIFDWLHLWGERKPGYITNDTFSQSLISLLENKSGKSDLKTIISDLENDSELLKDNPNLKANLQTFFNEVGQDTDKFKQRLEKWFDDVMDRVSGWYKREAHTISLITAGIVMLALNANTIGIAESLWLNEGQRTALAQLGEQVVEEDLFKIQNESANQDSSTDAGQSITDENTRNALNLVSSSSFLPLGWQNEDISKWSASDWLLNLLGWMVTVFALSLGAPFWFDMLSKVINIRTSGTKPASTNAP